MKIACCPYCNSEHFHSEAVRADAVNLDEPERFAKVYGHWFNQCFECDGWSIHKNGKQFPLNNKDKKPKKHSEPVL